MGTLQVCPFCQSIICSYCLGCNCPDLDLECRCLDELVDEK